MDEELSEIEGKSTAYDNQAKNRTFDNALSKPPLEIIEDVKVEFGSSRSDIC